MSIAMHFLRCIILLWIATCTTITAQVFHVVAPNTLRLDSDETIGIAIEGVDSALVDVKIEDHPGKIKVLSQAVLEVRPGHPEVFRMHLDPADFPPAFLTTPNSEKLVSLSIKSNTFSKEIQIPISSQAGYVFIQTDKPLYKPTEIVHLRIITLTEDRLPSDKSFKLQIKNPKGVIVKEEVFNQNKFQNGFVRHKYTFPTYPIFGVWSVTVNYGYQFNQNTTVHFELQKYVLPTFTVELKTPDIILESDKGIPISVKAKYVYGKKVKGMVTFRLGVKGEAPTVTYFAVIKPHELVQGSYHHMISAEEISHQKDIGWFPEIEGSYLVVEATVIDSASGNKEVATDAKSRFSSSPFLISFARCLKDFRPGLISTFEADIKYADGKPAPGIPARITASADGGVLNITRTNTVSNEEGKVSFELHPEIGHEVIRVTLETTDPRYEGNQAVSSFEQNRFTSADRKSFIALERSSNHKRKIGDTFVKLLHLEPPNMKDIYFAVVARGRILLLNKLKEGLFKTQEVNFQITHEMVPNFRIVAWTQYNKQLLSDSLNIDVEHTCAPDAEVTIIPEFNIKEPGAAGKIIMQGTKRTQVGLLGVDEAVYALSKKDLLTKSKMFETFTKHDLGCGPGGGLDTDSVLSNAGIVIMTDIYSSPPASSSSCVAIKRRRRAIASEKLQSYIGLEKECCALGLSHDIHGRTCEVRTSIVTRYLKGEYPNCSRVFLECCLHAKEKGFTHMKLARSGVSLARNDLMIVGAPEFVSVEDEEFLEQGLKLKVRQDFREMWFFEDFNIKSDNKEVFGASLPHSITTWVIQGVTVSPKSGMCVTEPQKLISFKKVFLQLNLPYSVVRNEQVEIQASVFNYGDKTLNVIVYMYGVKDICSGANEGEKSERKRLVIEKESAGTVTFPVIPLKEGAYDIKVVALSPDGSDIIMRKLNVIAEGYPTEVDIPLILDPSNQQNRKKRHVTEKTDHYSYTDSIDPTQNRQVTSIRLPLPEDFVPGTESCIITALGDQFGPIIETALNNPDQLLLKPRGCGEQNIMFFAPTLYTMRYLKVKGKITPEIEEKGYSFIRHGYGNQMSFRKDDGSYAAYLNTPTSIWLTAFVIKVFCQANELIHIDENVMCSGVKFLVNNQLDDGSFIEHRAVYHVEMMGGVQGKTPLTAFTLITMEECECSNIPQLHIAKKRALAYLEEHLGEVEEPLAVAIMAYALSLSDSVLRTAAMDRLNSLARHDEDRNMMYWSTGDSAHDVEATAYALLNHVFNNDMDKANSIVNWLNTQKLQSGAFKSTQDTVIALQALSEYAIRAQMPSMNLVANMSSSNDRNFYEVMAFDERNAHVLQDAKMNKVGGTLYIHTAGHGVGSLAVKLRYNKLHPPHEKLCKFDLIVNVTEEKNAPNPDILQIGSGRHDVFDRFPPDLIRGAEAALNDDPEQPIMDIDPRNRSARSSLVPHELFQSSISRRVKRRVGLENSKLVLQVSICARHLGGNPAGMSIIDVGIFSGFQANEEDINKLLGDQEHLIDRYEKSNRGIVFYLRKVPSTEHYCFHFHITREFMVGKTHSSVIKVYDYYNPDDACSTFYSPGTNSPLLLTLCDGGICQCAEGGCPPRNPFDVVKSLDRVKKRETLKEIACENYDFVWKGKVNDKIEKQSGFYNISFEILEIIKEGIEKNIKEETRFFLARDNCETAVLTPGVIYLIMGKDGQKYKNEQDEIWHRYLLDKKSAVYLWTDIKKAKDKELQRALNGMVNTLQRKGCDQ